VRGALVSITCAAFFGCLIQLHRSLDVVVATPDGVDFVNVAELLFGARHLFVEDGGYGNGWVRV